MRLKFQFLIFLVLFCGQIGFSHTTQSVPPRLEITPQREFLALRVEGDWADLVEAIHADAHALGAHRALQKTDDALALQTISDAISLSQGRDLVVRALQIERISTPIWPSGTGFVAWLRAERPSSWQKSPLRVSSRLFDYLESARTTATLRGEIHSLPAGGFVVFAPEKTRPDLLENARNWFAAGVSHAAFSPDQLLFLAALLLGGLSFSWRARFWMLGLWLAGHTFSFSLATLGLWQISVPLAAMGTGFCIVLMALGALFLAWREKSGPLAAQFAFRAKFAAQTLCWVAGLVQGFAVIPANRALFPDSGFGWVLAAYLAASILTGAAIFGAFYAIWPRVRAFYDAREKLGAMGWNGAAKLASGGVALGGLLLALQKMIEIGG